VTVTSKSLEAWPRFAGLFGKNRSNELEIADGDGIEDERVVLFVVADPIEMAESGLCVTSVVLAAFSRR